MIESVGSILGKVFKRNFFVHNATELFIYPGIAAVFVPLLNIYTIIILLIIKTIQKRNSERNLYVIRKGWKYYISVY